MSLVTKRRVWGLPIILFHWALVALLCVSLYTGYSGGFNEMDYHFLAGYGVLTLVMFRIIWGFLAAGNARFSHFIKGPTTILRYIKQGDDGTNAPGHNPLGSLSVIIMLLLLTLQVSTGLFASDDIFFEGPLYHLVNDEMSKQLTSIHKLNQKLLIGMMVLHIIAIAYYEIREKQRLILPMITGKKLMSEDSQYEKSQQLLLALCVFLICSGLAYYIVNKI